MALIQYLCAAHERPHVDVLRVSHRLVDLAPEHGVEVKPLQLHRQHARKTLDCEPFLSLGHLLTAAHTHINQEI